MSNAGKIKQAQVRERAADNRRREGEILLCIARSRIAEMEHQKAMEDDERATRAVRHLAASGKIKNDFAAHEFKAQFLADPELISLAVGPAFNWRRQS